MRMFRIFRCFRSKSHIRTYFNNFAYITTTKVIGTYNNSVNTLQHHQYKLCSTENYDFNEYSVLENETFDHIEKIKYVLFKNCGDILVNQLSSCSSLEEVWNLYHNYKNEITEIQITQIILVLKDLQIGYCKVNCSDDTASSHYLKKLKTSSEFSSIMDILANRLDWFNSELLSCIFLYLHKLGMHTEEYPMMMIAEKLQKDLLENFNIGICSRWMKVIFLESGIRPYYMSLDMVPKILNSLDVCDSVEDLADISTCLSKLQNIVTSDIISTYTDKVENFLENGKLRNSDHSTILKVVAFLSFPTWKDRNVPLMSRCMLLLKNEINRLDIPYLLLLYEIFFKIQEPGDLLTEIQRSTAKFWQQFEESGNLDTNTALKLFSALIYFNSPLHRIHLQKHVNKLLKGKMTQSNLILLGKIFSYVKISDKSLCEKYWNVWSNTLREDASIHLIMRASQNYMQFNTDVDNYRNKAFEGLVLEMIKDLIRNKEIIEPFDLAILLTFVIFYSKDENLLETLLQKLKDNPLQMSGINFLIVSRVFQVESGCCFEYQYTALRNILKDASQYLLSSSNNRFERNTMLIKAAIFRNEYNNYQIDSLLTELKDMDYMSSKFIENICYIFFSTNTLVPEVFNKMTEYVVKYRSNIVGFNAEKMLYLCYHSAYIPINADKFFQAVTDIIIRDQERLSGLAFLQSALSLSFFNKLPSFLVKQIFNVEFMDKLDNELANCYSKEKYPQRVRQTLMYLNRIVCLEYPEFNVPWFHEKYIKDTRKRYEAEHELVFTKSIKEYLLEITGEKLLENVITPYGYHVDFVVQMDKEENIVSPSSQSISKRVALLLVRQYAFTRFYCHLRGTYQMKMRHLEIMGYNVSILKFEEWTNLLYASERVEYLKKLIWPENAVDYVTKGRS